MFIKSQRKPTTVAKIGLKIALLSSITVIGQNIVQAKTVGKNEVVKQVEIQSVASIATSEQQPPEHLYRDRMNIRYFAYANGYINVHKKSSQKSSEKFLLHPGQKVEVVKEFGNWVKIETAKDKVGYVKTKFLANSEKQAKKTAEAKAEEFRITGYCSCRECSEGYGNHTSSGRIAEADQTVAADLDVLPMYTDVYIKGLGQYTVEDVGGGVNGKHIDVYVNQHAQCSKVTKRATKVYVVEG